MSDDDDDYAAFGKPLREIHQGDVIRHKPVPVEEQTGNFLAGQESS